MPSTSTQSIARIFSSKLSPRTCFKDWASAWAVYVSAVSKVAPGNLPDLISDMLVITEAAKCSNFDWKKYDLLFRQGAALDGNKHWGAADPNIWVHCLGKHQLVPVANGLSNPYYSPKSNDNNNANLVSTASIYTVAWSVTEDYTRLDSVLGIQIPESQLCLLVQQVRIQNYCPPHLQRKRSLDRIFFVVIKTTYFKTFADLWVANFSKRSFVLFMG